MQNREIIKRVKTASAQLQRILDDEKNNKPLVKGYLRLAIMDLLSANDCVNQQE